MTYSTLQTLLIHQFECDTPDDKLADRDVRDGVRQLVAHCDDVSGIGLILTHLDIPQLQQAQTYIQALRAHRDNEGQVLVYGVFTPDYRSQWFVKRGDAEAAFLAAAKAIVEKTVKNTILDLTLSPTRVDFQELAEYIGEEKASTYRNESQAPSFPARDSDTPPPSWWDLLQPDSQKGINEQVQYVRERSFNQQANNTSPDIRFSALQEGNELFMHYVQHTPLRDDTIAYYLDNLNAEQLIIATTEVKELLAKKTSRGEVPLYVVKAGETTHHLTEDAAKKAYLEAATQMAKKGKGYQELGIYTETFRIESLSDLTGLPQATIEDFLLRHDKHITPVDVAGPR